MTDKPKKKVDDQELPSIDPQVQELTLALQRERADATNLRRRHDEEMANLRTRLKANCFI